jgi:hypothetical protein
VSRECKDKTDSHTVCLFRVSSLPCTHRSCTLAALPALHLVYFLC